MRFLADESCDFAVVRALRSEGHDVLAVSEMQQRSVDNELMDSRKQTQNSVDGRERLRLVGIRRPHEVARSSADSIPGHCPAAVGIGDPAVDCGSGGSVGRHLQRLAARLGPHQSRTPITSKKIADTGRASLVTHQGVYDISEKLLDAIDAAPTGSGTVFTDQMSKDWMESSVLRALRRLESSTYHCANMARLARKVEEDAGAFSQRFRENVKGNISEMKKTTPYADDLEARSGQAFNANEIAYELDAFLAAARGAIDFAASVLVLHLGMNRRTSITKLMKAVSKEVDHPFAFLLTHQTWVASLRRYRDECIHYRALQMRIGYEAVHRSGSHATAIIPAVIPEAPFDDYPDTRAEIFGRDFDSFEGLDRQESWGAFHSISYIPSGGYIRVEDFCAQNLDSLRGFLAQVFEEALRASFQPHRRREGSKTR